jgi:cytochrome c biogenesis protein CcmG/thiol:disulfide interchange protein DsbE
MKPRIQSLSLLIPGLILITAMCGCSRSDGTQLTAKSNAASDVAAVKSGPEFDLAALSGGRLKSSDLKGKIVVVDFWATWCVACIQETPELNAIYEKYKDQGVQLVGISVRSGDISDIRAKVKEWKMEYPVAVGDDKIEQNFGGPAGLIGLPMTYILTKDWKMDHMYLGATPFTKPAIEKELDMLLNHTAAH